MTFAKLSSTDRAARWSGGRACLGGLGVSDAVEFSHDLGEDSTELGRAEIGPVVARIASKIAEQLDRALV